MGGWEIKCHLSMEVVSFVLDHHCFGMLVVMPLTLTVLVTTIDALQHFEKG